MTGKIKDGGPAFPFTVIKESDGRTGAPINCDVFTGMTLRDYFAADAPISLTQAIAIEYQAALPGLNEAERANVFETLARIRYEYADAMLKERSK